MAKTLTVKMPPNAYKQDGKIYIGVKPAARYSCKGCAFEYDYEVTPHRLCGANVCTFGDSALDVIFKELK